ncbi:MAG TPA: hypothetical protein DHW63_01285 [Hyphomonadaceae bacterium]|nr:hypothetical protein [Hyphomonadaceae bacterium]
MNFLGIRGEYFLVAALALCACGEQSLRTHRGMARAVIERGGGGELFTDASTAEFAAVRHAPSGLLCEIPRSGDFSVEVFPPSAANPGVYCASAAADVATSYVAVLYGPAVDIDTAFSQALAASAGQASPQVWSGEPSAADKVSPEGLPHFRIARFSATVNGEPAYLRVAMAEARGWFLQQIVSGPIAEAEAIEATAGEGWRRALTAFAEAP